MFFHLFYNMFCLKVVLNLKVSRRFHYLLGMPADWTELPFLEAIYVRESPAGRAPYNEVHDKEVMRVILIKIYRLIVKYQERGGKRKYHYVMLKGTMCTLILRTEEAKQNETPLLSDLLIKMLLWNRFRSWV